MNDSAKLYEVKTPSGSIYAVHDPASRMVWTERTEHAARDLARDKRLTLVPAGQITREQLVALMGHEQPSSSPSAAGAAPAPAATPAPAQSWASPQAWAPLDVLPIDDDLAGPDESPEAADEPLVVTEALPPTAAGSIFATARPLFADTLGDADVLTPDAVQTTRIAPTLRMPRH